MRSQGRRLPGPLVLPPPLPPQVLLHTAACRQRLAVAGSASVVMCGHDLLPLARPLRAVVRGCL